MKCFKLLTFHILLGTAIFLTSCSKEKRSEQRLEAAKAYLKKNEYPSAEIELKSALGYVPGNVEALTKLGSLYVKQGITLEPQKLRRAMTLKLASILREDYTT
jgi:Tfp pilus assembly protein PilF